MNFFGMGNGGNGATTAGIPIPAGGSTSTEQDVFKGFSFTKDNDTVDRAGGEIVGLEGKID